MLDRRAAMLDRRAAMLDCRVCLLLLSFCMYATWQSLVCATTPTLQVAVQTNPTRTSTRPPRVPAR